MSDRAYSWPDGHWDWYQHLAFKHGVRAGRLIFVGGQVDKDPSGEPLRPGDLEAQTAVVVRHIDTVLRGFGASMADVTKLVALYATDGSVDETEFVADVGRQVLANGGAASGPGPVITPIPLPCLALPGMRVEIEAVAMLGPDGESLPRTAASPIGLPPLPAPFVHGVRCAEHVWVGAQVPRDQQGQVVHPDDATAQTTHIFDQIHAVLGSLGADLADVNRAGCWYRGDGTAATWEPGARARMTHFSKAPPVITELPSPRLPAGETSRLEVWAMRGVDGDRLERIASTGRPDWQSRLEPGYPHAMRCLDMVFVGGQLPLDTQSSVRHAGDLNAQTRSVMEYTRDALDGFGLGLDDMVKQTSFYLGEAKPESIVTNQRLRSSYYAEPAGASTGVPMPTFAMEDVMVTVETIAMTVR